MRIWIMPFAALMLGSCQPPNYDLLARLDGSQLVIEPRKGGGGWFGWKDDTIDAGMVAIYNRQGEGWMIQFTGDPGCEKLPANTPYPLRYGKVPRCYRERAPAPPIRPGVDYKIDAGIALRRGYGAFRITPEGLVQLRANSAEVEGERWPDEASPAYAPMTNTANPSMPVGNGS